MVDQYAVFGNPIAHSVSPQIHRLFAQATMQPLAYGRQCVDLEGFQEAAASFFAGGGAGLNITTPFKLDAYQFATGLSERARLAGAVNTLIRSDGGEIYGDNTDGAGLVADLLVGNSWPIKDCNILVLGAGGAVRGVLAPLLAEQPTQIVIANRSVEKARQLVPMFSALGNVHACSFDAIPPLSFDLVINAASAGLSGEVVPVPASIFSDAGIRCYDMIYGAQDTAFLAWVKSLGCTHCSDGLGMLVGQAAESFYLWRGVRPERAAVIDELRTDLTGS